MAEPLEEYLDEVIRQSRLPRHRAESIRAELKDHLAALIEESGITHLSEVRSMLEDQFGNPSQIGRSLAPTYPKKSRARRLIIASAVAASLFLGVRATLAEVFYAVTDAAAPQVPAGSRCLVFKHLANYHPGDVIAFHHDSGDSTWLGIVKSVDAASASVVITRKHRADMTVPKSQVVGRVVANTR